MTHGHAMPDPHLQDVEPTRWSWPWWATVLIADIVIAVITGVLLHFGAPIWLSLGILGAIAVGIFAYIAIAEWLDTSTKPWIPWAMFAVVVLATFGYGTAIGILGVWWEGVIAGIVALAAMYVTDRQTPDSNNDD